MAANVETMFSVREKPWHGLGVVVEDAPSSKDALNLAGLDWRVVQKPLFTNSGLVEGYKANVRDSDNSVLGVVTDRYKVVQNTEAFAFTDNLLGEGVKYETAGSLQGGKKVWLLARLPREYIMYGERITPYLVFSNTHDGSGAVKVAITPVRIVCNNTLNLALSTANRCFSIVHTGDIKGKIDEAKQTLFMADEYMEALGNEFERMRKNKITDQQVKDYIEMLLPMDQKASPVTMRNIKTHYKFDTEHKVIIDASGPYIENKIINATQIRPFNLKELYDLMKNVLQLRGVTDEIPEYVEGKMFSFIPRKV